MKINVLYICVLVGCGQSAAVSNDAGRDGSTFDARMNTDGGADGSLDAASSDVATNNTADAGSDAGRDVALADTNRGDSLPANDTGADATEIDATFVAADAGAPDGETADAATATCTSRTFACGRGVCDALSEFCDARTSTPRCVTHQNPGMCYPCSTSVLVRSYMCDFGGGVTTPSHLSSDRGYPYGCTIDCN